MHARPLTPYQALQNQGGQIQGNVPWAAKPAQQTIAPPGAKFTEGGQVIPLQNRAASGSREEAPALQRARAQQRAVDPQPRMQLRASADEGVWDEQGAFNPMAYGGEQWKDGLHRMVASRSERLFDRFGQLNAQDNRDALQQIQWFMQHQTRNAHARGARFHKRISAAEAAEQQRIMTAAVQDERGFRQLGAELLYPIKAIIDYEAWGRRLLRHRDLKQGEFYRITKDVRSAAMMIGQDGQGIETRIGTKFLTPDEFKIGSFPTVDIEDLFLANYDLLDRAQDTARQEIELQEDIRVWALIHQMSSIVNTVTLFGTLGIAAFEDVRYQVERHRLQVEHFLINRAELGDIVKTMSANVDPVTERDLILAGYIGRILNAAIMCASGTGVQEVVPAGSVYAVAGPDYLGEFVTRIELFSEPFNMFNQFRFVRGFAFGEQVGMVIPEPRACARGTK